MFDLTRSETFENAKLQWLPKLTDTASDATGLLHSIAIVDNKSDPPVPGALYDDAVVSNRLRSQAMGFRCQTTSRAKYSNHRFVQFKRR